MQQKLGRGNYVQTKNEVDPIDHDEAIDYVPVPKSEPELEAIRVHAQQIYAKRASVVERTAETLRLQASQRGLDHSDSVASHTTLPLSEWTPSHLQSWLNRVGLSCCAEQFALSGIDGAALLDGVDEHSLIHDLKIESQITRKTVLRKISELIQSRRDLSDVIFAPTHSDSLLKSTFDMVYLYSDPLVEMNKGELVSSILLDVRRDVRIHFLCCCSLLSYN